MRAKGHSDGAGFLDVKTHGVHMQIISYNFSINSTNQSNMREGSLLN